jgi:hypothetical protein
MANKSYRKAIPVTDLQREKLQKIAGEKGLTETDVMVEILALGFKCYENKITEDKDNVEMNNEFIAQLKEEIEKNVTDRIDKLQKEVTDLKSVVKKPQIVTEVTETVTLDKSVTVTDFTTHEVTEVTNKVTELIKNNNRFLSSKTALEIVKEVAGEISQKKAGGLITHILSKKSTVKKIDGKSVRGWKLI